jgi:hypothetical protein
LPDSERSGNSVLLSIAASSSTVCTIALDGMVTFAAPGTCRIVANQAGNAGYRPAPQVTQSVAVFRR